MTYFKEIVFSPIFKEVVVPTIIQLSKTMNVLKARAIFEYINCDRKNGWHSMVDCINCQVSNKTLEELLEDGIGCSNQSSI